MSVIARRGFVGAVAAVCATAAGRLALRDAAIQGCGDHGRDYAGLRNKAIHTKGTNRSPGPAFEHSSPL